MLEPLGKCGSARMVVPGLAQIEPRREIFEPFQAITFGRLSRETDRIKQVRLAIASFADACSPGRPSSLGQLVVAYEQVVRYFEDDRHVALR
jgi:hypothetical protein